MLAGFFSDVLLFKLLVYKTKKSNLSELSEGNLCLSKITMAGIIMLVMLVKMSELTVLIQKAKKKADIE